MRLSLWSLALLASAALGSAALPPDHMVLVILENHAYSEIVGNANAPYINNTLVKAGALLTKSFAFEHPSQPNYLDLFSGANQGVVGDNTSPAVPFSTANLGAELLAKSLSFAIYSENLPSVGFTGDSFTDTPGKNEYMRKHNPAVNWQADDAPATNHLPSSCNQPFTAFPQTADGFALLPTFSIVVPNEQNDMHDGTVAMADTWLAQYIEPYRVWAMTHNSVLILTFDEDDSSGANQITTIFVGEPVVPGMYDEAGAAERAPGTGVDHFNVLRTIEDLYGLGTCIAATDGARTPITDIFGVSPSPTPSPTPTATPSATPTPSATSSPSATPTPTPAQLLNISTRMEVMTGNNVLIGGFIITGSEDKKVLVRALGPSLPVTGPLADPMLELHNSSTTLTTNDNWKINDANGASQQADIEATGIPPHNDLESALVTSLPANGSAYTAIVRGTNDGTGIGQVEIYDLAQSTNSQLANISTRGFVDTGDNVMIGGFISGNSTASSRIIIRGIGPSLGIDGSLQDPILELHDENGAVLATNDNWQDDPNAAQVQAAGVAPKDSRESALYMVLAPANYTAIVRGVNSTTGIGLVEVFNLQ